MPAFDPKFSVHVAGNDILVTLQGTSYAVTYGLTRRDPFLVLGLHFQS